MHFKRILNRIERQPGFVYEQVRLVESVGGPQLEVRLRARRNNRPICSGCGAKGPGYDRLVERRFRYVPLWGMAVWFVCALRRVDCRACGVRVERVPWAQGKGHLTVSFAWFLARWAKRLSWKATAEAFGTSWESVYRSVQAAVSWGLARRSLEGIESIGVDEIASRRGHRYLTLVYQIDAGRRRLLWVAKERTEEAFLGFFDLLGFGRMAKLKFISSDMWRGYLQVAALLAPQALHVLDRFHVVARLNAAIDQVRRSEQRRLAAAGYEAALKHSRWCLLKRRSNLTGKQTVRLRELLRYNLATVRAYLMKEDFERFWQYVSPGWAERFLDEWTERAMRSRLEPMKKFAATLRRHRELLLNWFRAGGTISSGVVEGFNRKAKLTIRNAYGYRTDDAIEAALYHHLGALPEPTSTHRFC